MSVTYGHPDIQNHVSVKYYSQCAVKILPRVLCPPYFILEEEQHQSFIFHLVSQRIKCFTSCPFK